MVDKEKDLQFCATHFSGTCGINEDILTVISIEDDDTGKNIKSITCDGVTEDNGALRKNDIVKFIDNISGLPNLRMMSFAVFTQETNMPVTLYIDRLYHAKNGIITFGFSNILLKEGPGCINNNIVAGMKIKVFPTHNIYFPKRW